MFYLIVFSLIALTLSSIVMNFSILLSKKMKHDFEKMSPFECGFDPVSFSRMPLSINFFFITIIFLIFDVELALLLPMVKIFLFSIKINWLITSFMMILILLMGIYYEWHIGALNWVD